MTLMRVVGLTAVLLTLQHLIASAAELPLSPKEPLPAFCRSTCQQLYYGDRVQSATPEERDQAAIDAQDLLAKARAIPDQYKNLDIQSEAANYTAAALEALGNKLEPAQLSLGSRAAISVVTQSALRALKDHAERTRILRDQLILEATNRLVEDAFGKSIFRSDGTIDRAPLLPGGWLNKLFESPAYENAPDIFKKMLTEHTDRLAQLLEADSNLKIENTQETVDVISRKLAAIETSSQELLQAAQELRDRMEETRADALLLQADVEKQGVILSALAENSLSPRSQLELARARVLELSAEGERRLERLATSQELSATASDISSLLTNSAQALSVAGFDKSVTAPLNDGSKLVASSSAFATTILSGGTIQLFGAGLNLFATLGSLGNSQSGGEQMEGIFKQLSEMQELIKQYHRETMLALKKIDDDIHGLGIHIDRRFDELISINERIAEIGAANLKGGFSTCRDLARDYSGQATHSLSGLDQFFTQGRMARYSDNSDGCLQWLSSRIDPGLSQMDVFRLIPKQVADAASPGEQYKLRQRFVNERYRPTSCYSDLYGTLSKDQRVKLGASDFVLHEIPQGAPDTSHASAGVCSGSAQYDPYMVEVNTLLDVVCVVRKVLPWSVVLRPQIQEPVTGRNRYVLTQQELATCDDSCRGTIDTRPKTILEGLNGTVTAALVQERTVAGGLAAGAAAWALRETILPSYSKARRAGDLSELQKLISGLTEKDPAILSACVSGDLIYDTLCILQTNPLVLENSLRLWVHERLRKTNTDLDEYALALNSPKSDRLRKILGKDVFLRQAHLASGNGSIWVVELPRVIVPASPAADTHSGDSPQWTPTAASCWDDYPTPVRKEDWARYAFAGFAWDQARCYRLPAAESLVAPEDALPISNHPVLHELSRALSEVTALLEEVKGTTLVADEAKVERALSVSQALAEQQSRSLALSANN
jgi:hypothetical protein